MKPGEGLVGLIAHTAEPLALSDAQSHPAFSYKPETGEEIYQSFLGVPVLRGGATLGVLVVQNRARRTYSDEEIEALQTTAMLLAEMIASGELQSITGLGAPIAARRPETLIGQPIAEGLGLGHVVLHQPRIAVAKIVADDITMELDRLERAIEAMRASVDDLIDRNDDGRTGEHPEVLEEAFRMIAHDRGWLRRLREAVTSRPHRRGGGRAGAERCPRQARTPGWDHPRRTWSPGRGLVPRRSPRSPARTCCICSARKHCIWDP